MRRGWFRLNWQSLFTWWQGRPRRQATRVFELRSPHGNRHSAWSACDGFSSKSRNASSVRMSNGRRFPGLSGVLCLPAAGMGSNRQPSERNDHANTSNFHGGRSAAAGPRNTTGGRLHNAVLRRWHHPSHPRPEPRVSRRAQPSCRRCRSSAPELRIWRKSCRAPRWVGRPHRPHWPGQQRSREIDVTVCWEGRWRLGPPSTIATVYTLRRDVEDVGFGSGRAWQLVLMTWGASAREGATVQAGNKRPVQPFRPTHSGATASANSRYFSGCSNPDLICSADIMSST